MFMILCAGYIGVIILLEAGPVYNLFMADIREKIIPLGVWLWIAASFSAVLIFSLLAIILPMRFGEKRLSKVRI
jgi:ABC-2 type transport system permease protein